MREQKKSIVSVTSSVLMLLGVASLLLNEFSTVATALTSPVVACSLVDMCGQPNQADCVSPSGGGRAMSRCGECIAAGQALADTGGFSREACVGSELALPTCSSDWATFFLDTQGLRQTARTNIFTIAMFVLVLLVGFTLFIVGLFFKRRSALALIILPFHYVLRRETLLHISFTDDAAKPAPSESANAATPAQNETPRRQLPGHPLCCRRSSSRINCSFLKSCCHPACSRRMPSFLKFKALKVNLAAVFVLVVIFAVVLYYSWKMLSIDAMLWQMSSAPVTLGQAQLWLVRVTCDIAAPVANNGTGYSGVVAAAAAAAAAASNSSSLALTLLVDLNRQRRNALSAPGETGILAKVPSILFAVLLIGGFLGPKIGEVIAQDAKMYSVSVDAIITCPDERCELGAHKVKSETPVSRTSATGGIATSVGADVVVAVHKFEEVVETDLDDALFDLLLLGLLGDKQTPPAAPARWACCRSLRLRWRQFMWPFLVLKGDDEQANDLLGLVLGQVERASKHENAASAAAVEGTASNPLFTARGPIGRGPARR